MTSFAIEVDNAVKTFEAGRADRITAVDEVSLSVPAGAMVAVSGRSGSGKSTLLHLIGAMDRADSGSIRVGDTDVAGLPRRSQAAYRRSIGFVFQRFHLLPALTVLDNVVAPVVPYKTDYDKQERGRELLDAVGLADRARSLPSRLSGGQQQRVAIARALVNRPGLLLADEPTGNLDSTTGKEFLNLLADLRRRHGTTVLIATHDPLVASHCERVVTLEDGRVVDDIDVPDGESDPALLDRLGRLDPHH